MKFMTTLGAVWMIFPAVPLATAAQTRLYVQQGSTLTIEGNNTFHTWKVQTSEPHGWVEFPEGLPGAPSTTFHLGEVPACMEGSIPIRSLRSNEGSALDGVVHRLLREDHDPLLRFRLIDLKLKVVPESRQQPYVYDSQTELIVPGVTNRMSMPVQILALGHNKLRMTGYAPLTLSAFHIPRFEFTLAEPAGSKVKYEDRIDVSFQWVVGPKDATNR